MTHAPTRCTSPDLCEQRATCLRAVHFGLLCRDAATRADLEQAQTDNARLTAELARLTAAEDCLTGEISRLTETRDCLTTEITIARMHLAGLATELRAHTAPALQPATQCANPYSCMRGECLAASAKAGAARCMHPTILATP